MRGTWALGPEDYPSKVPGALFVFVLARDVELCKLPRLEQAWAADRAMYVQQVRTTACVGLGDGCRTIIDLDTINEKRKSISR